MSFLDKEIFGITINNGQRTVRAFGHETESLPLMMIAGAVGLLSPFRALLWVVAFAMTPLCLAGMAGAGLAVRIALGLPVLVGLAVAIVQMVLVAAGRRGFIQLAHDDRGFSWQFRLGVAAFRRS